jgi:hypothetical protein
MRQTVQEVKISRDKVLVNPRSAIFRANFRMACSSNLCVSKLLLHRLRQFNLVGQEIKRSMEWLIKRLINIGAKGGITIGARSAFLFLKSKGRCFVAEGTTLRFFHASLQQSALGHSHTSYITALIRSKSFIIVDL